MSEHHRTSEWAKARATNRLRIAATLPAPCIDCGRPVLPDQKWQVGHIVSVVTARAMGWTTMQMNHPSNLGPTHAKGPGQRACNQIAGGKLGAAKTNEARRAKDRRPNW